MHRVAIAALSLALAACAVGAGDPSLPDPTQEPMVDRPDGLERRPTLPDDEIGALAAYGQRFPDEFCGLYIDQESGGTVVLLFTVGQGGHARQVAALAPGTRTEVRSCRYTEAQLRDLMERIDLEGLRREGYEVISAGVDTISNVVSIEAKSNLEGAKERLEARYNGMVVATISPLPGPWRNAESGDGWRLLAAGRTDNGEAYTVRAAVDASGWTVLWREVGLGGELPEPDLAREIVVSFGEGIGSSCLEVRLDDVVIDGEGRRVHAVTSDPLGPRACTADLTGTMAFVVALERDALPVSPFQVRLGPDDVAWAESVEVDLRP